MAVAALIPYVPRPDIVVDTPENCLSSLGAVQMARSIVYNTLETELAKQNPAQLDQIRDVFQTILAELNGLKQDSAKTIRCINLHNPNSWQTPGLDEHRKEEERLNALELRLRESAARKGWIGNAALTMPSGMRVLPVSQRQDLLLDTRENCLASLQIVQAHRQTTLKTLEFNLLGAQGDLSLEKRSEVGAALAQANELASQALLCLTHYASRWPANEQYKKCAEEQEKLIAREKAVFFAAAKHNFDAHMAAPSSAPPQPAAQVHLPIPVQGDLKIDTSESCLHSLKLVQEARSRLLERLEFLVRNPTPDRFEIERLFQDVEKFRHLSRFCLERYRWTPEAVSHDTVKHQTRCNEEARLDALESTVLETALEKGWIGRTVSMTPIELPSTEKIIRFCKAHPLIPLGLAGSAAGFGGWIPMENPLGPMAPALAGFLTSVAVDPKQTVLDTIGMSDFLLKNLAKRALPIATSAIGAASMYDTENLSRAPYLLGAAALLQMGAHYELWKTSLSAQSLATNAIDGAKWWFRNGYKTGAIAAAAAGAVSYSFEQSYTAIGLFGLGLYGVHAGFAFLHAHTGRTT